MITDQYKINVNQNEEMATAAQLAEKFRQGIMDAVWLPGSQLPTRRKLADVLEVSYDTVQRAFDALIRDGFVVSDGRRGTFVSDFPPHAYQYGLVFELKRKNKAWSQFHEALDQTAANWSLMQTGQRFKRFYHIVPRPRPDDIATLMRDARNHCLRGLIYMDTDWIVDPLLTSRGAAVPGVTISPAPKQQSHAIPCLYPGHRSLVELSLTKLAERGRKRIATLTLGEQLDNDLSDAVTLAAQLGMRIEPQWRQVGWPNHGGACQVVHLLMSLPPDQRPDGLIIMDDNLIHEAGQGLAHAGVRVGQDIDVVAHANFPYVVETPFPVIYVGFDMTELLNTGITMIEQKIQTPSAAIHQPTQWIPAVTQAQFEERAIVREQHATQGALVA